MTPPSPINPSVAKGVALGLGLLLLLGTGLLITLLILKDDGENVRKPPEIELQAGDSITSASIHENKALFVIDKADGSQEVFWIDLSTGERVPFQIRTR